MMTDTLINLRLEHDPMPEYNYFFTNKLYTDCRLVSSDVAFDVHRLFLSSASPLLAEALDDIPEEHDVTIIMPDFDQDEVAAFLNLMYGMADHNDNSILPVPTSVIKQVLCMTLDDDTVADLSKTRPDDDFEISLPAETSRAKVFNLHKKMLDDEDKVRTKLIKTIVQEDPDAVRKKSRRCYLCNVVKRSEQDLLNHVRDEHGQHIFNSTVEMLKDMKLMTYSCCDKVFFDKQRWTRHRIKIHFKLVTTIRQPLTCEMCDHSFIFTQELLDITLHNALGIADYRCPLGCQQTFSSRTKMSEHLEACPLLQKILCPLCGDYLKNADDLKKPLRNKTASTKKRRASRAKSNNCHLCSMQFSRFESLELHLKRSHNIHNRYPCKLCDRTFSSLKKVTLHQNIHERRFECHECGKLFDHKTSLNTHLANHEKSRHAAKCNICGKKFYSAMRLKDHLNVHTGERPHKCDMCDFASLLPSGLTHHKRRIHNIEPDGNNFHRGL